MGQLIQYLRKNGPQVLSQTYFLYPKYQLVIPHQDYMMACIMQAGGRGGGIKIIPLSMYG